MKAIDYIKVVRSKEEIHALLTKPGLGGVLLRSLEKQFGCSFGTTGFLAGQSVSSAIDEYLGLSEGLQYSDLDVFSVAPDYGDDGVLTAELLHTSFVMQRFKRWLRSTYSHLSEEALVAASNDLSLRSIYLNSLDSLPTIDTLTLNRLAMSGVEAVEASDIFNYAALVDGGLQKSSYKITGIHVDGPTQHIYHTGVIRDIYSDNGSCLMTSEEIACFAQHESLASLYGTDEYLGRGVLQGFDINSVQVGISLSTGAIIYTDSYVQYLHNRQMHITTSTTPFQSMVRALKKHQHGTCFFNKEEYLDVLRHVLAYRLGEPLGCYVKGYEVGSIYKERVAHLKEFSRCYYTAKDSEAKRGLVVAFTRRLATALKAVVPEGNTALGAELAPLGGQGLITTWNRISCLSEENKEWLHAEIELHPIKNEYVLPVLKRPERLDSWKQIGLRVMMHPSLTPTSVPSCTDGTRFTLVQGAKVQLIPIQEIIGLSPEAISAKIEALGSSTTHYVYGLGSTYFANLPVWNSVHCMIRLSQHKKAYRDALFDLLLLPVSKKASICYDLPRSAQAYLLWKAAYDYKLPAAAETLSNLPKSKYGTYGWYSGPWQDEELPATYRRKLSPGELHTLDQLHRHMLNKGRYPTLVKKSPEELWFRQEVDVALIPWLLQEEKHLKQMAELLRAESVHRICTLMTLCPEVEALLDLKWGEVLGVMRVEQYLSSAGEDTDLLTLPDALATYPTHEMHAKVNVFLSNKASGKKGVGLLMDFFSALLSIAFSRARFRLSSDHRGTLRYTRFSFTDAVLASCVEAINGDISADAVMESSPVLAADLSVRELVLAVELLVEGQEMNHCVGGYSSAVAGGTTRILSYSLKKGTKTHRATAEVRGGNGLWHTIQLRSKRNAEPVSELKAIHQQVMTLLSQGVLPDDLIALPAEELVSPHIAAERELQLLA